MFDWRRVKASETLIDGAAQSDARKAWSCSVFSNRYWPEAHSAETTSHMKHHKMVKPKSWGGGEEGSGGWIHPSWTSAGGVGNEYQQQQRCTNHTGESTPATRP